MMARQKIEAWEENVGLEVVSPKAPPYEFSVPNSKKLSADKSTVREDLFGGKGAVQIWNCLSSQPTGPFKAALWCALAPGGFVGRHRQVEFPEIVLCVGGTGRAIVDDTTHSLEKGVLVYLPLGSALSLHNDSDSLPLDYVILKAQSSENGRSDGP